MPSPISTTDDLSDITLVGRAVAPSPPQARLLRRPFMEVERNEIIVEVKVGSSVRGYLAIDGTVVTQPSTLPAPAPFRGSANPAAICYAVAGLLNKGASAQLGTALFPIVEDLSGRRAWEIKLGPLVKFAAAFESGAAKNPPILGREPGAVRQLNVGKVYVFRPEHDDGPQLPGSTGEAHIRQGSRTRPLETQSILGTTSGASPHRGWGYGGASAAYLTTDMLADLGFVRRERAVLEDTVGPLIANLPKGEIQIDAEKLAARCEAILVQQARSPSSPVRPLAYDDVRASMSPRAVDFGHQGRGATD